MDPFVKSHQRRVEHIVNNVRREVEQRLRQNEVWPSKCSTSNLGEESDLDKGKYIIEYPHLEGHEEDINHLVCGSHEENKNEGEWDSLQDTDSEGEGCVK